MPEKSTALVPYSAPPPHRSPFWWRAFPWTGLFIALAVIGVGTYYTLGVKAESKDLLDNCKTIAPSNVILAPHSVVGTYVIK